jgi:hypothetical protein
MNLLYGFFIGLITGVVVMSFYSVKVKAETEKIKHELLTELQSLRRGKSVR